MKIILCLAFFGLTSGFDIHGGISPDPQHFLEKYALVKLYESCFGREMMVQVRTLLPYQYPKCSFIFHEAKILKNLVTLNYIFTFKSSHFQMRMQVKYATMKCQGSSPDPYRPEVPVKAYPSRLPTINRNPYMSQYVNRVALTPAVGKSNDGVNTHNYPVYQSNSR